MNTNHKEQIDLPGELDSDEQTFSLRNLRSRNQEIDLEDDISF